MIRDGRAMHGVVLLHDLHVHTYLSGAEMAMTGLLQIAFWFR
jgi:hypothetical protein